jgi:putative SOS response-associated peptidase YedK
MCGRYGFYNLDDFGIRFDVRPAAFVIKDNYNAAPGQILPVIIQSEYGKTIEPMKWGLIPHWSKDPGIGYKLINARAETLFDKPSWRGPIKYHRCLVPARGFYEWEKQSNGSKALIKQPYFIRPKDQELFAFAGIYDTWLDHFGNEVWSFSIITVTANKDMAKIHHREPVILQPEEEALWLDPSVQDRSVIETCLRMYPDGNLELIAVSQDVNIAKNNDQHLIYPMNSQ